MGKRKLLTEKEFKKIKHLQELGFTMSEAAKITKRSTATTSRIYGMKVFAEYKAFLEKLSNKYAPKGKTVTPETMEEHNGVIALLRAIEYQLQEINKTLKEANENNN